MSVYIIIFLYYLFFCSGLFYQINSSSFRYRAGDGKIQNRKSFGGSLVTKMNLVAAKVGHSVENIYSLKSRKRYSEILDILANEREVNVTFNSFIGYKIILMIMFMVSGCFIGSNLAVSVILSLAGGTLGYLIPNLLVKRYDQKRLEELNNELPYAVDLLYIATLSGQNIYNAIKIVVEKYRGGICIELAKFLQDVDFGRGKLEAYKNMMQRNSTEDFKNLVFLLMQAEKYGSSISEVLKQKSNYIKFGISQNSERRSRKITLVMIFPLVFLILPSFVILVCGPLIYLVGGNFLFF